MSRADFLVSHLLVRLAFVGGECLGIIAVGGATGAVRWEGTGRLLVATIPGLVMFLGIGHLIGGRFSSPQVAVNLSTLIQWGTLFISGVSLPLWLMPHRVAAVLKGLPTTMFGDMIYWGGHSPLHNASFWITAPVVLGLGIALMGFMVRNFRWDAGEGTL